MNNLYATINEAALKTLIILSLSEKSENIDTIAAIDFISTFGKDYNISSFNLNGDNTLKVAEFTSRRRTLKKALEFLVINKYITMNNSNNGISFEIQNEKKEIVNNISSTYSKEYKNNVIQTILKYSSYFDNNSIIKLILNK